MKKCFVVFVLTIVMAVVCVLSFSASTAADEVWEYTIDKGKATITKYKGLGGAVDIPAQLGRVPVISIGNRAFDNCTSLTSVVIPRGVISIEMYSFYGCTSLKSVTIPDSVKVIDAIAFYGCTSLKSITIPDSVKVIGVSAFAGCTNLKTAYFKHLDADVITSFGINAFGSNAKFKIIYSKDARNFTDKWRGYTTEPTSSLYEFGKKWKTGVMKYDNAIFAKLLMNYIQN